jgi:hypothetical protein
VIVVVAVVVSVVVASGVILLHHGTFIGRGGIIVNIPVTVVYVGNDRGYLQYEGPSSYSFEVLDNGSVSNFTLIFLSSANSSHWITKIYSNSSGIKIASISPSPPFSITSQFSITIVTYSHSQNMWRSIPSLILYSA